MRSANQNSPPATPTSTTAQKIVSISLQHGRRRTGVAAAISVLTVLAAACSGGGKHDAAPPSSVVTTTVPAPTTTVAPTTTTLATGAADLGAPTITAAAATSAAGTGALDPTLESQIVDGVHTYVNAATGTPLGTGQAAVLEGVLTPAAAGRLTAGTRDALADEGLPALAAVKADRANVSLDGFMGPDQSMIVNAALDLQVSASTPTGTPVKIVRSGTLTFVNDGGTWRVDAFDLAVERDVP